MYDFSLPGGEKITLSELVEILGIIEGTYFDEISDFIAEIEDVKFSDESLVKVTPVTETEGGILGIGGTKTIVDWELESLQPFDTEEELTITMKNGEVFVVVVTDEKEVSSDLNNMLDTSKISINGELVSDGSTVTVKSGDKIELSLHFAENDDWQFVEDGSEMRYTLPEGLILEDGFTTTFDVDLGIDGTLYRNTVTYDKTTNQLVVKWNTSDPNFEHLTDADNAEFSISISAYVDSNATKIEFSDDVVINVDQEDPHDVSVEKSGTYDPATKKINYTVKVKSEGSNTNVRVSDKITGSNLTYNKDVSPTSGYTVKNSDDGFTIVIPSMTNGQEITFTYSADVNLDGIQSGNATIVQTGNKVTVSSDEDPGEEKTHYVREINYSDFSKTALEVTPSAGNDYQIITWQIVTNSTPTESLAGSTITDKIGESSQSRMSYDGKGLTIEVYNASGKLVETRTPSWSDVGVNSTSDKTWTYNVPELDGVYKYVITYTTKVSISDINDIITVNNSAEGKGGNDGGSAPVGPSDEDKVTYVKSAAEVTEEYTVWNIVVNIPPAGMDSLVLTDTLPGNWINSVWYADSFVEVVDCTGLIGSEHYEITNQTSGSSGTSPTVEFTFYKDAGTSNPGLNSNTTNRTLTLKIKTKNNQDWLEAARESGNSTYVTTHTNTAKINNYSAVSATANPIKHNLTKETNNKTTYNGLPAWPFQITLQGLSVSDLPLVIEDTFDTTYFEFYEDQYNPTTLAGGKEAAWPREKTGSVTAEATETGVRFTITELPLNGDVPYGYYAIWYRIKVKDESALSKLNQLALNNYGTITFKNIADDGTSSGDSDFDYEYKVVSKSAVYDDAARTATYTIRLNPDELILNNGNPMTMTDTFSTNQSIDYSTITVTATRNGEDVSNEISYDYSGNRGTYIIPDETSVVITYTSRLLPDGNNASYSNTAYMAGYSDSTTATKTISSSGEGSATSYRIRLFKYAAGHMESGLGNAVFRILDAAGNPITYKKGANKGKEIIFTTGTDGYVEVKLSQSKDGVALKKNTVYYLEEINPPAGYESDFLQYSFIISDDPDYNAPGGFWVYHNNDILKIRNYKETGGLTIAKRFSGNVTLTADQKNAIQFTIEYSATEDGAYTTIAKVNYSEFANNSYSLPEELYKAGYYRVTETNADVNGYVRTTTYQVDNESSDNGNVTVTSETLDNSHSVVITNQYNEHTYEFTKIDADSAEELSGAVFAVYKATGDIVTTYTSDSDGHFTIEWADEFYEKDTLYYIVETKAPEGYELPSDPTKYYFYFSSDPSEDEDRWTPDSSLLNGATAVDLSVDYGSAEVENGTPVESDELSVVKEWKNESGGNIPAGASSVEVTLKRYTMVNPPKTVSVTLTDANKTGSTTVSNGGDVTVTWTDGWWSWNNGNMPTTITVNGESVTNGSKNCSWSYSGKSCTLTISSVTTDLVISLTGGGESGDLTFATSGGGSGDDGDLVRSDDTTFSKAYTLSTSNSWSHQWTISDDSRATAAVDGDIVLPATDDDGNTYYYYVVETSVEDYTTTYNPASGGVTKGQITVTNTGEGPSTGPITVTILKVDSVTTSKTLTGAKFQLVRYEDDSYRSIVDQTTWPENEVGSDGTLTFTNLIAGYYKLVETESPDGYVKTSSDPTFTVKVNKDGDAMEVEFTDTDMVTYSATDKTFTVKNELGVALPSTGGVGTTLFTLIGSTLVLLAGAVLLLRRKRLTLVRTAFSHVDNKNHTGNEKSHKGGGSPLWM